MSSPVPKQLAEPARTSPDEARKRALRRLWWREAMLSPWTPVVFFALVLLPYIALVELHTPAHLWARPLLKSFGLAMFGWVLGLFAWKLVSRPHRRALRSRAEARDQHREVSGLMAKHGGKLEPKAARKISEALDTVEEQRLAGDIGKLAAETSRLAELADKHLSIRRPNRTVAFAVGIAKALAIALAIRTVFIEPYRIPSGSMIPTLEIGDQIFINKFIYGVRIPFTNWVPFVIVREPRRGDVAVFENPTNSSVDMVKRIVAVAGDKVEFHGKQLFLNGEPQPLREIDRSYVFYDHEDGVGWKPTDGVLLEEQLDGRPHPVIHLPSRSANPEHLEAVVPPGHVFVLGDDRDNSDDSRTGLGDGSQSVRFLPLGRVKGKAMIIWLSLGYDGIGGALFGGTGLRTDRLFLPVR
ncbi:MAG: signal peptidase I [Myxococcales bacterium]|nr:signal peptidase I [Myxococcales bacterium]